MKINFNYSRPKPNKLMIWFFLIHLFGQETLNFAPSGSPCFSIWHQDAIQFNHLSNDQATKQFSMDCPDSHNRLRISAWFKMDPVSLNHGDLMVLMRYTDIIAISIVEENNKLYFGVYYVPEGGYIHWYHISTPQHWSYFFYEISPTKSEVAVRTNHNMFQDDARQDSHTLGKQ